MQEVIIPSHTFAKTSKVFYLQTCYLNVELSDGQTFSFDCDNGEGYFNFDNFDPYYVDFDSEITPEILTDLQDNCI